MFATVCQGGEFEQVLEKQIDRFVVENPGPDVTPVIYCVGQPDRSNDPVRKTKGVTLNGVRLTETLLSESVLILYPDGSGKWGYHAGFDIFREPQFLDDQRVDPRTLVEYDKWRYDPLEPVRCVGADMNLLQLHSSGPMPPALYEIAFPGPIRIRSLEVRSNCDQIRAQGVVVKVRLSADRQRQSLIAERRIGPGQPTKAFPIRFADLDHSRLYLELSAEAPRGTSVGLYWTFFEATLDATELRLPVLNTGKNEWTLRDDADGSHRARLVLRWVDRPPPEHV